MQFGRIFGIAMAALGITLLLLQFALYMALKQNAQPAIKPELHTSMPLPGLVGAGLLVIGIASFVTARRKDG